MRLLTRRNRPGKASIKEGLDNLPSGICFADHNGMIVLCNRQMYRLCYALTGADLQHITELYRGFETPRSGVTPAGGTALTYRFPDHTLWQFARREITGEDGSPYIQVQAIDVTELHEKIGELEQETRVLEETNQRAKRHYAALDRIVLEEETLAMKMRVHDDIGRCLLSSRNLLTRGGGLEDYKKSGEHWARTISLMEASCRSGYAPQAAPTDEILAELVQSAREIGIRITIGGNLPPSKDNAYLMIVAMRECVTNAVRHAFASEVTVTFTETEDACTVSIINDGRPPEGEVIEGGGLSGLRRSVESKGGMLTVETRPVFRLTVTLPEKEEIL